LDHDNERRDTKGYLQEHGSYSIVDNFTLSDFGNAGYPAFERNDTNVFRTPANWPARAS
jgi:hypothetical protein